MIVRNSGSFRCVTLSSSTCGCDLIVQGGALGVGHHFDLPTIGKDERLKMDVVPPLRMNAS